MSPRAFNPEPTTRQAEFLRAYVSTMSGLGMPPTFRDIAEAMGGISPSAVFTHAAELEGKGFVVKSPIPETPARKPSLAPEKPGRRARSFRLTGRAWEFLGLEPPNFSR